MNTIIIGTIINAIVLIAITIISKVSEFKLEKQKGKNAQELEYENKKRELYSKLAISLGVFIENRYEGNQQIELQKMFYEVYDQVWIWGGADLIKKIGDFLQGALDKSDEATLKRLHTEIILEMRKDLKMSDSDNLIDDYKFINFKK